MSNNRTVQIDGSQKSGSGTIVRDAVLLSILTNTPIELINIRSKRPKPGLRHQHLKVLEAACEISGGVLQGAFIGSDNIKFYPGKKIRGGQFSFDIGTAGSATMLALCCMPLGLFAPSPSTYHIFGGLFQDFAPSAFHLTNVMLPIIRKMGADIEIKIVRPGYVPKGKGILEIKITPLKKKLSPITLTDQGRIMGINGCSLSSYLEKRKVSERMANECRTFLESSGFNTDIQILNDNIDTPAFEKTAVSTGAALAVWAYSDTGCLIGADMAGALRRSAEYIGRTVAHNLVEDIASGACSDRFQSDQLIPFAVLAAGNSRLLIPAMTNHIDARLWVAKTLTKTRTNIHENLVQVEGIGYF